jgi:hypothetical protein
MIVLLAMDLVDVLFAMVKVIILIHTQEIISDVPPAEMETAPFVMGAERK